MTSVRLLTQLAFDAIDAERHNSFANCDSVLEWLADGVSCSIDTSAAPSFNGLRNALQRKALASLRAQLQLALSQWQHREVFLDITERCFAQGLSPKDVLCKKTSLSIDDPTDQDVAVATSVLMSKGLALWQCAFEDEFDVKVGEASIDSILIACASAATLPSMFQIVVDIRDDNWASQFKNLSLAKKAIEDTRSQCEKWAHVTCWEFKQGKLLDALRMGTTQISEVANAWATEKLVSLKMQLEALAAVAAGEALESLEEEVLAKPIDRHRAKHLFKTFCCSPDAMNFCSQYKSMVAARDGTQSTLDSDIVELTEDMIELRTSTQQIFDSVSKTCGMLTSMVGLWRSLHKGEKRPQVANDTLSAVQHSCVPAALMQLLTQASQGRATYASELA